MFNINEISDLLHHRIIFTYVEFTNSR